MAKATPKKPYHTITVRLQPTEYEYLKSCKAKDEAAERRTVPYTEILIKALRSTREAMATAPKVARAR